MKTDIWMPLYLADYDQDTSDLTFEEHGFYMAILRNLWVSGGVLEMETGRLTRRLRTDKPTFDRLWPAVVRFFIVNGATFSQKRLTEELAKASARREIARENGSRGGRPNRAVNPGDNRPVNPGANPEPNPQKTSSPSPSPSPSESSAPAVTDSSVVDRPRREPAALTFPCSGKPALWELTFAQVDEWAGLYPGLDVVAEAAKALAWVKANNRKTAKGMPRFLVSWLGRATNGARGGNHVSRGQAQVDRNIATSLEWLEEHEAKAAQ